MATVRAAVCRRLGDPAGVAADGPALELEEVPRRALQPSELRIRVAAAGVNFADVLQLQGRYQEKPSLPYVPGSEVSGEVLEVGVSVYGLRIGDTVCAVVPTGGFAAECVADVRSCWRLPAGLDVTRAAGLPIAFGTAHVALSERARLQAGQSVLILGAGGGVGLAAVRVAKLMGARVVAVAGGAAKGAAVQSAGADVWIDSSKADLNLRSEVLNSVPGGVDVLFDSVGGRAFSAGVKCVRSGGQVLIIGFASGSIPSVAANVVLVKNLTLHGVYWGMYLKNSPHVVSRSMRQLLVWLSQGRLDVDVCATFPLNEVHSAVRVLFERRAVGKVLLLPPGQPSRL